MGSTNTKSNGSIDQDRSIDKLTHESKTINFIGHGHLYCRYVTITYGPGSEIEKESMRTTTTSPHDTDSGELTC